MKHFGIIFSLFVVLFFVQCAQENKLDDEVVFYQNKKANWIKDHKSLPLKDSLFYEIDPAPLFRKNFFLEHAPKKVQLFITAAGYYKAAVNGTGIENNILDPSWTDYSKRIYFKERDKNGEDFNGGNFIMFYRWICCLWKMMGLAFIAFLFDIYQVKKTTFLTF